MTSLVSCPCTIRPVLLVIFLGLLTACGETALLNIDAGYGPDPQLPPPRKSLIPTVNLANPHVPPEGWLPQAAEGATANVFADGLSHPRWLYVLPNGDVLVAETNAPEDSKKGVKGWMVSFMMSLAGAGVPSADRITLLRDTDQDGVADYRSAFLENLHSPFGMALVDDRLYVANANAVIHFPYEEGQTQITAAATQLIDLERGTHNYHWTKNLLASPDGSKLYVAVGSNSNVAENGLEEEVDRAAIWEIDRLSGAYRIYASGLRNPVGMAWEPETGELWATVNERDEIGSDLVPDYMTSVQDGAFYGWPYSYYGSHVDERVQPPRPDLVATALVPEYALGPHTASLGLTFTAGADLPDIISGGAIISQHGSWNRDPFSGYQVVFVRFTGGRPAGLPVTVLTGFRQDDDAYGRPAGVAIDGQGSLLVADDVGNVVWRVSSD